MNNSRRGGVLVIGLIIAVTCCAVVLAADPAKININTASAEELARLQGVGPVIAQRIVDYREQHGRFVSAEDLTKVPGVGTKTLEKNRERITID